MNDLGEIYSNSSTGKEYTQNYAKYLSELLSNIDLGAVEEVIKLFQDARGKGNTIFFIGNGGSAATCSHFSEDLSLGAFLNGKKPFKTISLTDNSPYITALGNDILKKGDVVVGISGSGNSPNLIKTIEYANMHGGITVGLLGFDGGKMEDLCKYSIIVKTKKGVYGPVEDMHLILAHIISTYLMFKVQEEKLR